jgi:Right handed beta helix region/Pectate lyase superfamily protein
MRRRDIPKALVASSAAAVIPRTLATTANPADGSPRFETQPGVDVRQYGAVGDGKTDDTAAITAALAIASKSQLALLLPSGLTFRITSYVQILSNTTVYLLGKIQLSNRSAGLYANGAANIGIFGCRRGRIEDSTVAADYRWNNFRAPVAPAIHLRSTTNVLIDGLNISHCEQGILISNSAVNSAVPAKLALTQASPTNCSVTNCNIQFCEMGAICSFNAIDTRYVGNYVYRCGDGGIWMMGARDGEVTGNYHISPYSVPADVAAYGSNNEAHPTTWNDEQGMEFENCHGLLVANNVVRAMWGTGIDIKNGCNRILVSTNMVSDCENSSITVREGDGVKNACHEVSIIGNTVSGHGTLHYGRLAAAQGAIRVGECFVSEVMDNIIHGYQTTPGIVCLGPGDYQKRWYPSNPHQGSLVVAGNCINFKNGSFELETAIQFGPRTLGAIQIEGQYDSVKCSDNKISTDRYLSMDGRLNAAPAISLRYVSANNTYYPLSAMISSNAVSNWGNWGIVVTGMAAVECSGLTVNDNAIGGIAGGGGIHLILTKSVVCSANAVNQVLAGSGYPGIWLEGSAHGVLDGAIVGSNQVSGGWQGGGNAMTYGIRLDYCGNCNVSNNAVRAAGSGIVGVFNASADIVFTGTTGFPRSGPASPNGSVVSYHAGEMYRDTGSPAWWIASSGGSTVWTKL